MKWINDIVTDIGNETVSLVRLLAIGAVGEYMAAGVIELWRQGHFPFQDFGVGLGATIAAVGLAMKLSEQTKPEDKP